MPPELSCRTVRMLRQGTFIAYLLVVHGLLALVLWKSDFLSRVQRRLGAGGGEITDHYERMLRYHLRMDGAVPAQSVVFIGDSLTQGLCTDAVASPSVNYGIGSDTTVGVLGRVAEYHCLLRASCVVLAIGVNDMKFRDNQQIIQNYRRILEVLPPSVPVVCSALLPVNESLQSAGIVTNARIRDLNALLEALCSENKRCLFVDVGSSLVDASGNLSPAMQVGDGVHLNGAGNRVWIDELRIAVRKAQQGGPANGRHLFR